MNVFEFFDRHWFLTFLVIFGSLKIIGGFLILINRILARRPALLKHGWPPEHCDADSDFRQLEEPA